VVIPCVQTHKDVVRSNQVFILRFVLFSIFLFIFLSFSDGCNVSIAPASTTLIGSSRHEERLSKKAIRDVFWEGKNSQDAANMVSGYKVRMRLEESNLDTQWAKSLKKQSVGVYSVSF